MSKSAGPEKYFEIHVVRLKRTPEVERQSKGHNSCLAW